MKAVKDPAWTPAERAVIARARWRTCVPLVLAVVVLLTIVSGLAYLMVVRAQNRQVQREVEYAVEHGLPTGPPGCTWLFVLDGGELTGGPVPAPPGFPRQETLAQVAETGEPVMSTIERNGTVYVVRTEPRGDTTVQVIFDTRYQLADRRHLLTGLLVADVVGLIAAAVLSLFVSGRAVAPLTDALARQRRFVADASHELRTPIAQVHTRAQLLARRSATAGLPDDHRAELDRLVSTTTQLGEVVDDLLLSAELAAAPADQASPRTVDLAALAQSAVEAECARAAQLRLTLALDRPDRPLPVSGVESALRRVVGELLSNAVAHTPPGGRIEVSVRDEADQVCLIVADTGAGFDPNDAERIFERFHRGPNAGQRRYGLGLALLREVVTSHHGTIEAIGHPGAGARFTVRLPAAPAAAPVTVFR